MSNLFQWRKRTYRTSRFSLKSLRKMFLTLDELHTVIAEASETELRRIQADDEDFAAYLRDIEYLCSEILNELKAREL